MSIGATLSLSEAARHPWDAAVVGAGPAGSLVARELARCGLEVLLIDKATFPRVKVCGCCLNGRALEALNAVGLAHLPASCGAVPLRSILLAANHHAARLAIGGLALSREGFDTALVQAAIQAGAAYLPATLARLSPASSESPRLQLRQGEEQRDVTARVLVAADGLGGALLARSGMRQQAIAGARVGVGVIVVDAPQFYERHVIYMACGHAGYLGLVRLEDDRLDLAAAFDPDAVRRAGGPGIVAGELLKGVGWPIPAELEHRPWRGTPPLTRGIATPGAERVFVVGDAAGYVEPFTGEGMAWALAGAVAVAPLAARAAAGWQPSLLHAWRARHRQVVRRRQTACRIAAAVLRRPWAVGTLVRVLQGVPRLAGPFVRRLQGP